MNLLQRKKWIPVVILFSFLGLMAFNNCSDSLPGPGTEEPETETISELLYVSGQQVTTKYSDWPIPENDVPSVDTTRIGFLVKIHSIQGEKNSVRVYGLEGADVGKREDYLYPDCKHPDNCKIIGNLVGEDLEINITNNGRSYQAQGNIYQTYDPYIEMTATYNYQITTIHYEVEGGIMGE